MTTLQLYFGGTKTFTAQELALTLAQLTAAGQVLCSGGDIAHVVLGSGLLLVDATYPPNRRLLEGFELTYNASNPFNIQASVGTLNYTLQEGLELSGYVGTITSLDDVYMVEFNSGGAVSILAHHSSLRKRDRSSLVLAR